MASRGKPANKSKGLGFDLSKPIKHGLLLKQGALHKAFKNRFFVLYPGFLVYYQDQSKWRLDVTRGDTLQVHNYIYTSREARYMYVLGHGGGRGATWLFGLELVSV